MKLSTLFRIPDHVLRRRDVVRLTGLSIGSIRLLELAGEFPRRFKIGAGKHVVGWSATEVQQFIEAQKSRRVELASH